MRKKKQTNNRATDTLATIPGFSHFFSNIKDDMYAYDGSRHLNLVMCLYFVFVFLFFFVFCLCFIVIAKKNEKINQKIKNQKP